MSRQSEQILEEQLITQLQKLGYSYIVINSEKDLLLNLKGQLEKHNQSNIQDISLLPPPSQPLLQPLLQPLIQSLQPTQIVQNNDKSKEETECIMCSS